MNKFLEAFPMIFITIFLCLVLLHELIFGSDKVQPSEKLEKLFTVFTLFFVTLIIISPFFCWT